MKHTLTMMLIGSIIAMTLSAAGQGSEPKVRFRLMTIDPGHFHAALIQKFMYADVDPRVQVYAPAGDDLQQHLKRIEQFNSRTNEPTAWQQELYTGDDFLEKALTTKPGNIVVLAGNNARKTEYILKCVQAGLHVLADKPMAITTADFTKLQEAFIVAEAKGVLLYDIMTERFEITTALQRELSRNQALFGTLVRGTAENPAITKESVHHFSKTVAGMPLKRPQWFFDVQQEGEGIVDVTTHLVDLVQWEAFPDQALQPRDVKVMKARRWSTPLTREQFRKVTGAETFPNFLRKDVKDDLLHVYSNGEFTYTLRGVHAKVSVIWNFEAPPGTGDTHASIMRGTRANLVIRQGANEQFKPVLHVENAGGAPAAEFEAALQSALAAIPFRAISFKRDGATWRIVVPEHYNAGHEAHFAQVTQNFLNYVRAGQLPSWERPNMLTKYATIMQAYELSR